MVEQQVGGKTCSTFHGWGEPDVSGDIGRYCLPSQLSRWDWLIDRRQLFSILGQCSSNSQHRTCRDLLHSKRWCGRQSGHWSTATTFLSDSRDSEIITNILLTLAPNQHHLQRVENQPGKREEMIQQKCLKRKNIYRNFYWNVWNNFYLDCYWSWVMLRN